MTSPLTLPRARSAVALAGGVLLLGTLTACGGGGDSTAAAGSASAPSAAASGGASGANGGFSGASGLVADISGKTLQVQGQSGQTAVTYTNATTFTAQVAAKLSAVSAGSCVMVTPVQDQSDTSSSGTDAQPTQVTAASVRITGAASDGSCDLGFGGRGGTRPSGAPTDLPSGARSERPSGAPSGGRGFGGFGASGKVLAVSATGFSVLAQTPGSASTSSSSSASSSANPGTTVTVTVSPDTTYTTTQNATAKALAVGKCVSANGQTDSTGAVTADRIVISDAVDGQCTASFGRFGHGGTSTTSGQTGTTS